MNLLPLGYQEEHTLLLLVVKRRRPQNSRGKDLRSHGGSRTLRGFGAKTETNVVQRTPGGGFPPGESLVKT
jgi:hypothetical protein